MQENWAIDDDSDTSDEESDSEDRHPDPHPADPDMTGWSTNQIGGYFYQKYKYYKKNGVTSKAPENPPAVALLVHEVKQDECDDEQRSQSTVGNVEPIQLVETGSL